GKYYDIIAFLFYNRGGFTAYAPGPGSGNYSGTAYTVDGIQRSMAVPINDWTYAGLNSNIQLYINELLAVHQDAVIQGSILHHGIPQGFDALTLGYSLNITVAGVAMGPWDNVNLPVRSVTLKFKPSGGATNHDVVFNMSNLRRPFQGEDLYIHPLHFGDGAHSGQAPFGGQSIGVDWSLTGGFGGQDMGGFGGMGDIMFPMPEGGNPTRPTRAGGGTEANPFRGG